MSASYTAFKCSCPKNTAYAIKKTSEPSGTSQSICTRTFRNLTEYLHRNPPKPHRLSAPEPTGTSTRYLHRNPPEPHRLAAPKPSRTSTGICTGTLQNLNPPEPHQVSAPEPSGTSTGICTLRNPPEPCPEPGVEATPDRTRANLG